MFILIFLILAMFQGSLSAQITAKNQYFTPPGSAMFQNAVKMPKMGDLSKEDIDASADSYEYVGSNLIARGHVVIKNKMMKITGDNAVINLKSGDAEVTGNVELRVESSVTNTVDFQEYRELLKDPAVKVKILHPVTMPSGRKKLKIEMRQNTTYIHAERLSGNMNTGNFLFRKFVLKGDMLLLSGELAERYTDGTIKVLKAKTSTCEYLLDSNSHYAIGAKEMILTPREANRSFYNGSGDYGDYSVLAKNSLLYVWNVPVFWFPALYKPRDFSSFGARVEFGRDSDWGTYVRVRKEFDLLDKPARVKGGILLDFYEEHGFGYGAALDITTPESSTELFAYSIRDRNPYILWEDDAGENPGVTAKGEPLSDEQWRAMNTRMEIPHDRYEFRISNITFFNPRLTFRGAVDVISDFNFLEEYFAARYNQDVQPPSFAALDYQGDSFSALVHSTFKVNSFDVTVERLPELRLDMFRQELFKGLYYQNQTSGGYYKMNWRKYDLQRWENPNLTPAALAGMAKYPGNSKEILQAFNKGELTREQAIQALWADDPDAYNGYLEKLKNYEAFRFDTLHAFYYPMRFLDAINLIPRAAVRLTAYSRSSEEKISVNDIYSMVNANDLDKWPPADLFVRNYDKKGGAKFRLAMELGAELNTKFYRTWQTPKSAFFQIDGLRHVMVPYINYTFIPRPTVDYAYLYYFDDVDQIAKQNFFRFGLINRLQTRGDDSQVREYFSMENYWDFHFNKDFGFNNCGDFTTILSFTPTEEFSFATKLILDAGENSDHDKEVVRGGKRVGRPGLSASDIINRWETTLSYKFSKDWQIKASYIYSDDYYQRATYSMASTLASAAAMTSFSTFFEREQSVNIALDFPTYIDERLKGRASVNYDVDDDLVDNVDITLTRHFHCWYLQISAGMEFSRNAVNRKAWEGYLGMAFGLTAMPGAAITARHEGEAPYYDDKPEPPDI
ncbi:MAG: LPS-assembly protein LptD [Lentisphaeria bacterium]|nr:LPS-assembly protein LptD [Lentisphaeria bacterium]